MLCRSVRDAGKRGQVEHLPKIATLLSCTTIHHYLASVVAIAELRHASLLSQVYTSWQCNSIDFNDLSSSGFDTGASPYDKVAQSKGGEGLDIDAQTAGAFLSLR